MKRWVWGNFSENHIVVSLFCCWFLLQWHFKDLMKRNNNDDVSWREYRRNTREQISRVFLAEVLENIFVENNWKIKRARNKRNKRKSGGNEKALGHDTTSFYLPLAYDVEASAKHLIIFLFIYFYLFSVYCMRMFNAKPKNRRQEKSKQEQHFILIVIYI